MTVASEPKPRGNHSETFATRVLYAVACAGLTGLVTLCLYGFFDLGSKIIGGS